MTPDWLDLPELRSCDSPRQVLRLPPETDVPLTDRVRSLINTPSFHRLTRISQLGLVATVYPGATHSRWEHSLGVYRLGLQVLRAISGLEEMDQAITADEAKAFLVAALLHDVGHWPFCHPIEDLRLTGVQPHERMAESLLDGGEFCDLLQQEWQLTPADVANVIHPREGQPRRLIHRLLSGPIDIDKLDYLDRDSLHAGVPYGRHFDRQRLIGAMCRGESLDALAITEKGKTAAELMVVARYVMFSEVYWHSTVRSATAMLQRAVFELGQMRGESNPDFGRMLASWNLLSEAEWIDRLRQQADGSVAMPLVEGLFGRQRRLFKRVAQYHAHESPELHGLLARRPYPQLVQCSHALSRRLTATLGRPVEPIEVLIDAPPVGLEVQFRLPVRMRDGSYRLLGDLSPLVQGLATQQFDDIVKRVRVFVAPQWRDAVGRLPLAELLHQAIADIKT